MRNVKWLKKTAAMLLAGTLMCGTAAWTGAGFAQEVKAETETVGSPIIGQEQKTGTLTILKTDNQKAPQPLGGAEFSIYKVMGLTPGAQPSEFATYEKVDAFKEVLKEVNVDDLGNYSAEDIENLAVSLATEAAKLEQADRTATTGAEDGKAVFENLDLGYYLVVETGVPDGYMAGQPFLIAIPSTDNYADPSQPGTKWVYDVAARPKNYSTGIDKEIDATVTETEDNKVSNDGTVKVGDFVPFKITTQIPDYTDAAYDKAVFTITDVMSDGLKLVVDDEQYPITVSVEDDADLTSNRDYTLTTDPAATGDTPDLTVDFTSEYLLSENAANKKVTVTYYAEVTKDAVAGTAGNTNQPYLHYTNKPGEETDAEEPMIKVYTFDINVVKFAKENGQNKTLDGAKFALYKNSVKDENKLYEMPATGGKLSFEKLDEGTYYLVETQAPKGYTLLANPIEVRIEATKDNGVAKDGSFKLTINGVEITTTDTNNIFVSHKNPSAGDSSVAVENHKGFTLPQTGGMGIMLFLAVGVAGIVVVSVLLTRKSKDAK